MDYEFWQQISHLTPWVNHFSMPTHMIWKYTAHFSMLAHVIWKFTFHFLHAHPHNLEISAPCPPIQFGNTRPISPCPPTWFGNSLSIHTMPTRIIWKYTYFSMPTYVIWLPISSHFSMPAHVIWKYTSHLHFPFPPCLPTWLGNTLPISPCPPTHPSEFFYFCHLTHLTSHDSFFLTFCALVLLFFLSFWSFPLSHGLPLLHLVSSPFIFLVRANFVMFICSSSRSSLFFSFSFFFSLALLTSQC